MIVLEFRFPAGRWHATAWGTHVNEGVPEWPPSPWRLCRALWATWFNKYKTSIPEKTVREIIELLIDGPLPRYEVPPAVAAHTRHYMPSIEGKKESKTKIFDTFVQVSKSEGSDRLLVAWNVELSSPQHDALEKLLTSMSYFGRAESLIEARLLPPDAPPPRINARPIHTEENDGAAEDFVKLLAPLPQAEFATWRDEILSARANGNGRSKKLPLPERVSDCLLIDTAAWKAAQWNQPPGSRWIVYSRPKNALQTAPQRHRRIEGATRPTVARFLIDGDVLPDITQALSLGERLHRALVKFSDNSLVFTGREAGGQPLTGHRHAFYFSEPAGPRGEVRYLTVYAPAGFGPCERAALEKLRKVWDYDQRTLRLTLISIGNPAADFTETDSSSRLFGPAKIWQSITPFIPTRHPKTRNNGAPKFDERGMHIGSPAHDLLRLLNLANPDLPPPKIEFITGPELPRRLVWLDYQRHRRHGNGTRSDIRGNGFRLTFSEPVTGPIALGYGAHFGLGLFVPVKKQ